MPKAWSDHSAFTRALMQDTSSFLYSFFVFYKSPTAPSRSLLYRLCHKAEPPTEKLFVFLLVCVKHSPAEPFLIFAKYALITARNRLCDLLTML